MPRVRVDLILSLDGFATTTDQTETDALGEDWARLTEAYTSTRSFRARVLGDTTGAGSTGVDDEFVTRYFEGVGAEIMGAGMFGLHSFPDDPEWNGWWGEDPPFRVPVFVLTHKRRETLTMKGGTTFSFVDETPDGVLKRAIAAAGGLDVRVAGGPTTARAFLRAGLVDDLHVSIAPMLLGRGIRLWDDLRGLENDYKVSTVTAPSGTIHVTFSR